MMFNGDWVISMGDPICFQNYSLIPRSRMIATMLFQDDLFKTFRREKQSYDKHCTGPSCHAWRSLPKVTSIIIRNMTFSFQHVFGCYFDNMTLKKKKLNFTFTTVWMEFFVLGAVLTFTMCMIFQTFHKHYKCHNNQITHAFQGMNMNLFCSIATPWPS